MKQEDVSILRGSDLEDSQNGEAEYERGGQRGRDQMDQEVSQNGETEFERGGQRGRDQRYWRLE